MRNSTYIETRRKGSASVVFFIPKSPVIAFFYRAFCILSHFTCFLFFLYLMTISVRGLNLPFYYFLLCSTFCSVSLFFINSQNQDLIKFGSLLAIFCQFCSSISQYYVLIINLLKFNLSNDTYFRKNFWASLCYV